MGKSSKPRKGAAPHAGPPATPNLPVVQSNPLGFPCDPCKQGCEAADSMGHLVRLLTTDIFASPFIDGMAARRLIATMLTTYRSVQNSPRWSELPQDLFGERGQRLAPVLAAIFDYCANVEYCNAERKRVGNAKWIYCHAARDGAGGTASGTRARVFYSFLKQCPHCCQTEGLGPRIEKAQHKPPSHAIGEITGSLMAMLLAPVLAAQPKPLTVALVAKQSHNVDAVAYNADLAVLFEIKASPLVSFPLAADRTEPLTEGAEEESVEYAQHALVDVDHSVSNLYFYLPHRNGRIPLGPTTAPGWPYGPATEFVQSERGFFDYLSAWAELFAAYCVDKTERVGANVRLAYLTNGWGDDIDSNKTKPGLGRTDDMKKGTYQLLKFGAYYKDACLRRAVYSALVANLDPVSLREQYLTRLLDVRWTRERHAKLVEECYRVDADRFYHLFEAIVAFNMPAINEPRLREVFDFDRAHDQLISGGLDEVILAEWL